MYLSSSAHNCECIVDSSNAMAAIRVLLLIQWSTMEEELIHYLQMEM